MTLFCQTVFIVCSTMIVLGFAWLLFYDMKEL